MEAAAAGPGTGEGGRGLSALLAGRSRKQKCGSKNEQKLQEAALRILSCHQNLGDLLLEVESSGCNTPACSSSSGTLGSEASIPELFVVSALQDQASKLGVPVGILSARTAASNIKKISAESGQTALLNAEQRGKLSCLLQTLRNLLTHNAFCHLLFAQEIWKMQSPLILELAWHLHRENIVSLEELLENIPDAPALVDWLCSSLCLLCHQIEDPSLDAEHLGCIVLRDFLIMFLRNGFQQTLELGKKLEQQKVSETCSAALERMLAWVLDTVAKEKQEDASALKAVKCWLCGFGMTAAQGTLPPESVRQFFSHTLTQVLTYSPQLKVSDAIHLQREWSFARTSSVLTMLYRKLFVVFKGEDLIHHLQQVLETSEVNWHHVLSCVSTLLVCHSEAELLVKDLLGHLLTKAFENYDLENMITAFLIVRQAALEGPAIFMPYSEWFKVAFGSASGFHSSSKKALVFLFKFLSELVPFEAPQYLKVHIMHPPFVPTKYRPLLLEYITLAKTRLADFKVSIEEMGLYEDLSSAKEPVQPHCQALQDAEKAIQIFENTGKIPASVMEASIFRRPYYISHFIPALLVPRVLPETPDSRMALIESLKRAEKIPLNTYATYLEGCRAVKEKLLQDGSTDMDTSDLKEPLELLKAELEVLRLLVADADKHDAIPAQIAVVSEKLTGVLGGAKDEDEAACLTLRIKLNLSVPEVEEQHRGAVDLLLTSFCQNVMAASYFLPPDRQGAWPSLFVRMVCGKRRLLPPLLSRLCQLMRYQGSSLSDAQVIGLAVFAVHLNEAKSLIPEVNICSSCTVSTSGLSVTELWDYLLVCRTGDSMVFGMRFCTAALSYFLCKFSSLSHDGLCSLLHPGFVKKFQYLVPRLSLEARGISCEGGDTATLPWKTSSQPALCSWKAALCLWKQTSFKGLLQEKAFRLTLQEWLLMELGVHPDEDFLSACERQEFHYWALYQRYLPEAAAAGGCDGDLRGMCAILIGTVLDFCQRSELDKCNHLKNPKRSMSCGRGSPDIYCRLQEMLLELELERRRAPLDACNEEEYFLFQVLQRRLKALRDGSAVGEWLLRQQELLLQNRILLGLPPSILTTTQRKGNKTILDCEDFFSFVNTELRDLCSRGCVLPYDITAHFFRGLLSASLECDNAAQEVTAVFTSCQARCPIILCSAVRWWQRLEPMLCSEWKRLFRTPLAPGLQSLREIQSSVSGFLSSEAASLVSDIPWISAAFLHFTVQQQQTEHKTTGEVLKRLGPGAEQLLVFLFFFSVMDLISTRVAPQEGLDAHKALDWSSKVLRCLEELGGPWLAVFRAAGKGQGSCQILRGAVSDQHLRLLPFAFYSLLFTFDPEQLTRAQTFLPVAVDMYTQLLQLFMDGPTAARPSQREGRLPAHEPEDSLALIKRARQFLLSVFPLCPRGSVSNIRQLLDLCGVLDPEIRAALENSTADGDLFDEEPLIF